ncbi:4474_t:CDS:2, partial [Dentiscutata heterogama]
DVDCCESSCCVLDIYECAGEYTGRDKDAVVGDCAFLRFLLFLVVAGTISNSSALSKESLSSSGGIKAVLR